MLVRDKETGEVGKWVPGVGFQPVSAAEAQVMQNSTAGNIARAAGGAITDAVGFAVEMGLPQFSRVNGETQLTGNLGTRIQESNDVNQQARNAVVPNQELMGQGLALGAELASGGVANKVGRTLGKVDDVIKQNRQITQATRQADEASLAAQQARDAQTPGVPAPQRADGSVNAASNPALRTADNADVITPSQADAVGMPITPTQRKFLAAWESGDMDQVRKAEEALSNADYMRAMGIGDADFGSFADTLRGRKDMGDWLTQEVLSELGEHQAGRLTDNMMATIRKQEQQVFKEAFDQGKFPVELKFTNGNGELVDVVHKAQEQLDALGNPSAALKRAVDDIKAAAMQGDEGVFDAEKLLNARSRIMKDTETAFKAGESQNGSALSAVQEVIDDAIEAALPPDNLARVQLARRRWKIIKTVQRTAGTKSATELGKINPGQFTRNYRAMTPSYRTNSRATNDFEKMMTTIDTLTRDRAHTGNTLIRGVAPTALKAGGMVAAGGAGALDVGGLIGN